MWQLLKYWAVGSIAIGFQQTLKNKYWDDFSQPHTQKILAQNIITGATLPYYTSKEMINIIQKKVVEE